MMKYFAFIFSISCCLLLPNISSANTLVNAPEIDAKQYVLYDFNSRQVLVNQNGDKRIDPAAFTKLMTLYMVFQTIKWGKINPTEEVLIPRLPTRKNSKDVQMALMPGQTVNLDVLIRGLVITGSSDAAYALAHVTAGSAEAFVSGMNKAAERLGLTNTFFTNAVGDEDPQHYSSAKDLAILAAALIRDFPEQYARFVERDMQFNRIELHNPNRLLWLDPFVDGMMVSYSRNTRHSLIGSAERGQHRLVSVLIGADNSASSATESQKLLNHGFRRFQLVKLYDKNKAISHVRVWRGVDDETAVGSQHDLYVTIPRGRLKELQAEVIAAKSTFAPVSAGQKLATLRLKINKQVYAEFPLVALEQNGLANVFARGWDGIRLLFY